MCHLYFYCLNSVINLIISVEGNMLANVKIILVFLITDTNRRCDLEVAELTFKSA